MSIANISLHHFIMLISTTTKLFKRYIDDIVFLSKTLENTDNFNIQLRAEGRGVQHSFLNNN